MVGVLIKRGSSDTDAHTGRRARERGAEVEVTLHKPRKSRDRRQSSEAGSGLEGHFLTASEPDQPMP